MIDLRWTMADKRPRLRALQALVDDTEILGAVCVAGPNGEQVHWEVFWLNGQLAYRHLNWFESQGVLNVPCADPAFAPMLVRQIFSDARFRLCQGPAWQLHPHAQGWQVKVREHSQLFDVLPDHGESQVWWQLAARAGTPLPAAAHPFWAQLAQA